MTRVLLIADTERVQRIFHTLEERGVLQLQTVSTLALGESELAAAGYDVTFVQSRISGFSGIILLRHLDKILPEGAELVLLAGDAEDAAQAKKHGRKSLELSLDDEMLERTVLGLVTGAPLPEAPKVDAPPPTNPAPAKPKPATAPAAASPPQQGDTALPSGPPADLPVPESGRPAAEEPVPPVPEGEHGAASPFEEAMQRASAGVAPVKLGLLEVEDRVEIGKGERGPDSAAGSAGQGGAGDEPVPTGPFFAGETLAEAMRRAEKKKSRSPYLFIVPALVLIAIPLISYLFGRDDVTDSTTAPAAKPAPAPVVSLPAPPPAAGVREPAALPAVKGTPGGQPLAEPELKPAPKRGLDKLPPMLEGTRLDADYGKSHPGWVRYIGLRAEYKLFKEDGRFRAIQVMGAGAGTISDDLFRKMLREFGGVESYQVQSSSTKGDYLIEQCTANGSIALTIYRNRKSLKMKAFVVYYR